MKPSSTICDYVLKMKTRSSHFVAQKVKVNKIWTDVSWQEYYQRIEKAGAGLLELGVQKGDRVALMSNTRPEWSYSDYAAMGVGAVIVPIYQNSTSDDIKYILNNCEAKILIVENKNLLKIWSQIKDQCPKVEKVICFDKIETNGLNEKNIDWEFLCKLGESKLIKNPKCFENLCAESHIEDTATILYTSGTTGLPKGVVLTHTQIMSEIEDSFPIVGATVQDVSLSFLPYAHILGRIEHWGHMYIGFTLAYAESIEKIKANLTEIKPTFLISVPRIFEKIYASIWTQLESNPLKAKLFKWAIGVGKKVGHYKIQRKPVPIILFAEYQAAKVAVLDKVYEAVGGRLRFAISGGAPISKDIAEFFHAAGILILEGYGLTETTAAITVNTPYDYRFGSVGKPHGDTQIKIANDGEVLVKSKKVMKEYYKNPEATQEVMNDGWFATGDIGEILPSGDLKITDRKKDLIKTAGGKYVAPQRLENLLKLHPFISNVLVHGDQKKFIVCLITLDFAYIKDYAKENKISGETSEELTQKPEIFNMVHKAVAQTNSQLASFESIKKFMILPQEFTIEAGELTPSLKVKRKFLDKKFSAQIESLY